MISLEGEVLKVSSDKSPSMGFNFIITDHAEQLIEFLKVEKLVKKLDLSKCYFRSEPLENIVNAIIENKDVKEVIFDGALNLNYKGNFEQEGCLQKILKLSRNRTDIKISCKNAEIDLEAELLIWNLSETTFPNEKIIRNLKNTKKISELNLQNCDFEKGEFEKLIEVIKDKGIELIDLSGATIDSKELRYLSSLDSILVLNLQNCDFKKGEFEKFIEAIKDKGLELIDLSGSTIDFEELKCLLKLNPDSIQCLDLNRLKSSNPKNQDLLTIVEQLDEKFSQPETSQPNKELSQSEARQSNKELSQSGNFTIVKIAFDELENFGEIPYLCTSKFLRKITTKGKADYSDNLDLSQSPAEAFSSQPRSFAEDFRSDFFNLDDNIKTPITAIRPEHYERLSSSQSKITFSI